MKTIKYICFSFLALAFIACETDDEIDTGNNPLPELTAGTADFSRFVSVGASFTAGYTDGALFMVTQESSFPNIMANQFANAGGGTFTQPLTNDNFGGLAVGGDRIAEPRLVFGGAGPVPLEAAIGPITVSTDIATNNPTGPFNNLGIPGAKSYHLLAQGFGNLANLSAGLANPYAVRVTGSSPNASILDLAMDQDPSFFIISDVGGNDVLGYALSGGESDVDADNYNPITPPGTFSGALDALVTGLTTNNAKGAIGNIPNITSLSHFTTVPYNPLDPSNPDFAAQIPTLNSLFGALNGVYAFLESQGAIDNATERSVVFSTDTANAVVVVDENLDNISTLISQTLLANPQFPAFLAQFGLPAAAAPQVAGLLGLVYGQSRQATANDLFVLPSSNIIGEPNAGFMAFLQSQGLPAAVAGQFSVEGVTLPLEDKWVLIPQEQDEIAVATEAYNSSISAAAAANGLALVDFNSLLAQASTAGIEFDGYTLNTSLVTGGLISLDGIHLTTRGYALMANSFLKAIDTTYGSNFEASGNLAKADNYPVFYSPTLQ